VSARRRDLPARQTLYAAENLQLDLKIEVGEDKGFIIGQIVASKGIEIPGIRIELTERVRIVDEAKANTLGEFIFQDLPKGNYELQTVLSDATVRLPSLPMSG